MLQSRVELRWRDKIRGESGLRRHCPSATCSYGQAEGGGRRERT
jgi:hypothetical protein